MKYTPIAIAVVVLIAIIGLFTSMYIVTEKDQVFITRFGKIQGGATTNAGLYFKVPFVDKVRRFEKRILEWDGRPGQVTTKDKKFISIDTYARWRIHDSQTFFRRVQDEVVAQSRLDDIIGGATRKAIAKVDLVEVVRSDKDRKVEKTGDQSEELGELMPFSGDGREFIRKLILDDSKKLVREAGYGIELLDFQFKRINYEPTVQLKIFDRMIAERNQRAEELRSEGMGKAKEIDGTKIKELAAIESNATLFDLRIRGEGDANATRIYTEAYSQSPQSEEFYKFIKTMETYKLTLSQKDTLILSTKSEFFNYLKEIKSAPEAGPK